MVQLLRLAHGLGSGWKHPGKVNEERERSHKGLGESHCSRKYFRASATSPCEEHISELATRTGTRAFPLTLLRAKEGPWRSEFFSLLSAEIVAIVGTEKTGKKAREVFQGEVEGP